MTRLHGLSEAQAEHYYGMLWAVPGTVQALLGSPLLSRTALEEEALVAKALAEGREMSERESFELDMRRFDDTGVHQFAFLAFNLLVRSAVVAPGTAMSSNHDGNATLRRTPFAHAAAARAMELWLDELVRQSCGDALGAGDASR